MIYMTLTPFQKILVNFKGLNLVSLGETLLIALGSIILGLILYYILHRLFSKLAEVTESNIDNYILRHTSRPVKFLLPTLTFFFSIPLLGLSPNLTKFIKHLTGIIIILEVSWLVISLTYVLDDYVMERFRIDKRDNLQERKIHTQLQVFKRIVIFIVTIIALSSILMSFDKVRQFGASILASAGLASLIIGMSAQRIIGNFLAGIQIAITQPIRIDDVVIVEGEWGRIEEITLTYVVVRIWDLRRLVLPISYFIEKPFQNWTRKTADIMGTVYIYADYTIPFEEVRKELYRLLKESPLWDGKVWGLQITGATEHTVELRALMSSEDASKNWDLRCYIREKLIEFIAKKYPQCLPRTRVELFPSSGEKINRGEVLPSPKPEKS